MQSVRKLSGGLRPGKPRPVVKYTVDRKLVKTYPSVKMVMKELPHEVEGNVIKGLRDGFVSGEVTYQYEHIFLFESKFHE